MTATYRPIRCPHGADMQPAFGRHEIVTVYTDGCRASGGIPARFWCGAGEMSKPYGLSITEGEYLRDWAEALILNAGDELRDGAAAMEYDVCNGCGGLCELNTKGLCTACDNAGFLGEAPWTDRIED